MDLNRLTVPRGTDQGKVSPVNSDDGKKKLRQLHVDKPKKGRFAAQPQVRFI